MASPLLKTKLNIPPARPHLVARPRLMERLNEGLTRPLTLLSAPPGFGKTTLLTEWLEHQSLPAAWLSLDERDNDLARFLAYFVAALETIKPDIGRQALNRLHSRRRPSLESVMTLLSNDIAAIRDVPSTVTTQGENKGLWAGFILVLDDYHLIELQTIHEAMAFLLDRLPPPMHLVIATRADPPFPLTLLRARGQLVELRVPDLRFAPEEATAFLNEQMNLNLTPEQVTALEARAEGWIAGLQLAALSMQGRQDIAGFVSAFTGSNRFILDYLTEEVLQRQTSEIQTFLLQTSILDQMNAPLADAVTGRNDSALVLAQLEKANLFLIPLDDARQWYRYHHLFDDLLQSRLQQSHPEQVAELHRRAGTWYEQNGFLNEAIGHVLAIPDFERAAHLIEQAALPLLLRSENSTLFNWIGQLPDDLIRARPYLCLAHSAALLNVNKIDLAEARLAQVDDAQLDPQTRAMSGLLRATISLLHTDAEQALESARNTLAAMEASSADPNSPRAEFDSVVILYLVMILAELQTVAGQLRAAYATCCHGLEIGKSLSFGSPWALILGFLHFQTAELLYEFNEIGAANQHAARSLEICQIIRNEEMESYTLVALAQIKQTEGDAASAFDLLQRAVRLERKRNIPSEMWFVAARQVSVLIAQDRIEDAAQLVKELPREDASAWFIEQGMVAVGRARVLIAQREYALAVELLEQLRAQSHTAAQTGMLVEILALESLARYGQGDAAQARTVLLRALSLAEPEGYMRLFVDLGEAMRVLISDLRLRIEQNNDNSSLAAYADKLLAAFPATHLQMPNPKPPRDGSPSAMPEPLSERELAVLRLIAEGLSNQEIADRMVVALSTVKTHINNIYGKLDVASRTQALARAREFKLL